MTRQNASIGAEYSADEKTLTLTGNTFSALGGLMSFAGSDKLTAAGTSVTVSGLSIAKHVPFIVEYYGRANAASALYGPVYNGVNASDRQIHELTGTSSTTRKLSNAFNFNTALNDYMHALVFGIINDDGYVTSQVLAGAKLGTTLKKADSYDIKTATVTSITSIAFTGSMKAGSGLKVYTGVES